MIGKKKAFVSFWMPELTYGSYLLRMFNSSGKQPMCSSTKQATESESTVTAMKMKSKWSSRRESAEPCLTKRSEVLLTRSRKPPQHLFVILFASRAHVWPISRTARPWNSIFLLGSCRLRVFPSAQARGCSQQQSVWFISLTRRSSLSPYPKSKSRHWNVSSMVWSNSILSSFSRILPRPHYTLTRSRAPKWTTSRIGWSTFLFLFNCKFCPDISCSSVDIPMSEGPVNLNWGPIMKHINESPFEFFQQGGWSFLGNAGGVEVCHFPTPRSHDWHLVPFFRVTTPMNQDRNLSLKLILKNWLRVRVAMRRVTTAIRMQVAVTKVARTLVEAMMTAMKVHIRLLCLICIAHCFIGDDWDELERKAAKCTSQPSSL